MKKYLGYALIELLVVVAVLAIVVLFAVSHHYQSSNRKIVHAQLLKLKSVLEYAKSEALLRGEYVTVCPSLNGQSCNDSSWSNELLVFVDKDAGRTLSESDHLLTVVGKLGRGRARIWKGFPKYGYIQFMPDGLMKANNGTFVVCVGSGKQLVVQGLVISKTGRMRLTEGKGNIHQSSSGKALSCEV